MRLRWANEGLVEGGEGRVKLVRAGLGPSSIVPEELEEAELAVGVEGGCGEVVEWLVGELRRTVGRVRERGQNVALVIFDTIVSLPGVRMPFEELTRTCRDLGVRSCIDAAHAVGQIDIDLDALGCDFFVSNCHK